MTGRENSNLSLPEVPMASSIEDEVEKQPHHEFSYKFSYFPYQLLPNLSNLHFLYRPKNVIMAATLFQMGLCLNTIGFTDESEHEKLHEEGLIDLVLLKHFTDKNIRGMATALGRRPRVDCTKTPPHHWNGQTPEPANHNSQRIIPIDS
jgi:hypothetical protein